MLSSRVAEKHYLDAESRIMEDVKVLNSFIIEHGQLMEGNCFYGHHQQDLNIFPEMLIHKRINFVTLLKERYVKKMLEIGFNAGHSASIFLHMLPKDSVFIPFDLCEHPYTNQCHDYLKSKFPQLKPIVEGDSMKTLPQFINENPSEVATYDVIHVDVQHAE